MVAWVRPRGRTPEGGCPEGITRNDSGFGAWRNTDAVIVGDVNGSGQLTSLDASRLLLQAMGIARPEIPPLPVAAPPASIMPLVEMVSSVPPAPAPPSPLAPARAASTADAALLATAAGTATAMVAPASAVVHWSAALPDTDWSAAPRSRATAPGANAGALPVWSNARWAKDLAERLARPVPDRGLQVSAPQTASRFWRSSAGSEDVS